jgi:hypothetical protein
MPFRIGPSLDLWSISAAGGASAPSLILSAQAVAESASVGTLVGSLSVLSGSGTYAFTLTDSAGGLFALDGADDTRLELAATLIGASATTHQVTVEADNGIDDPIERTITINTTFDFYVDVSSGSDSNPGSASQPFATIGRLRTALVAVSAGQVASALVKTGTYPYSAGANSFGSIALTAGTTCRVYFETGCIFQGPNDTATDASWIDATGAGSYTLAFYGLGAKKGASASRVTGFDAGTGNGIGANMTGGARFDVDNFQIDDCVDGWSVHGTNTNMRVSNLVISGCSKGAVTHVHTGGLAEAFDCDFTGAGGASLGIGKPGGDSGAPQSVYTRCRVVPFSAGQTVNLSRCDFVDSELGSFTLRITATAAAQVNLTGCFCNWSGDQNILADFDTCWGFITTRHRNGGDIVMDHCHWGGPAQAVNSWLYRDFNPGAGSPNKITNTIFRGFSGLACVGASFSATDASQYVGAPADYDYVWFFGNTLNVDADIVADAGYAAAFTNLNQTNTDPITGNRASTAKASWALQPGSPCIGVGSGGSDIGFQ